MGSLRTEERDTMEKHVEDYNYEPFADTEEYRKVNGDITRNWVKIMVDRGVESLDRFLDIATGAGTMAQLFFDTLPANLKESAVFCLDQSAGALKLAKSRLEKEIDKLTLINSSIQELDFPPKSLDVAIWGNGIHYLDEEEQILSLKAIRKALKPGGWFFFNTSFYEGARPTETLPFYRTQVKNAVQFLKKQGVNRIKVEKRAEAAKFHPRSYYEELVGKVGFDLVDAQEFAADLTKEAWEHISSFQQYASGALHGYPDEAASDAMKNAVEPAILLHGEVNEEGDHFVTRKWLSISARA